MNWFEPFKAAFLTWLQTTPIFAHRLNCAVGCLLSSNWSSKRSNFIPWHLSDILLGEFGRFSDFRDTLLPDFCHQRKYRENRFSHWRYDSRIVDSCDTIHRCIGESLHPYSRVAIAVRDESTAVGWTPVCTTSVIQRFDVTVWLWFIPIFAAYISCCKLWHCVCELSAFQQ